MATKSQARTQRDAGATRDMQQAMTAGADLARQQLAAGAEALAALYKAGEAVQEAQLHLVQRAALLHRQAADNLRKAATPMELLGVQSTLWVYQVQEGVRYLQEMALLGAGSGARAQASAAASEAQTDASTPAPAVAAAAAVADAAVTAAQAWQQAFAVPLAGGTGSPTAH